MTSVKDSARNRAPRTRRTQSERSDETQKKIIQSALKLLQSKGIRAANLQDIARGAKVTLGAVQHHFPNRQVLMERLIDEVMAPLSRQSELWPSPSITVEKRAHDFVKTCWEMLYGLPSYVAAWSLFYGCKSEPELFSRIDFNRAESDPIFFNRFIECFPEVRLKHADPQALASLIFASLRGIGVFQIFNVDQSEKNSQLNLLANMIIWACQNTAVNPDGTPV